jgi:leucyl/phenylalanyl-tRNA--protein transferase
MISLLDPNDPAAPFPPVEAAEEEPNGLLAVGGDLSVTRLLTAYRSGIFPWYSPGQPILWWSPDPRTVLFPGRVVVSRSLAKSIRNRGYSVSIDRDFPAVIKA